MNFQPGKLKNAGTYPANPKNPQPEWKRMEPDLLNQTRGYDLNEGKIYKKCNNTV